MPTLEVAGASLDYETSGHISAPAVLLLDAAAEGWDPLAEMLARTHFVVRWRHSTGADDVLHAIELLDHLGLQWAVAVASGAAASLARRLAGGHPSRISDAVVVDLDDHPEHALMAWLAANGR